MLGHVGGEGNHVVLHLALDLKDALDFEARLAPDGPRGALRDQAGFRLNLRRSDFHFQPFLEFVLISPDVAHLRASVSRNHFRSPNLIYESKWSIVAQDSGVRIQDSAVSIRE